MSDTRTIHIESADGQHFYIHFDRTAEYCWRLDLPHYAMPRGVPADDRRARWVEEDGQIHVYTRGLGWAMEVLADHLSATEY